MRQPSYVPCLSVLALPLQLVNGRQEMMKVQRLALQASHLVSTHTFRLADDFLVALNISNAYLLLAWLP